jgi:hypothetical protein
MEYHWTTNVRQKTLYFSFLQSVSWANTVNTTRCNQKNVTLCKTMMEAVSGSITTFRGDKTMQPGLPLGLLSSIMQPAVVPWLTLHMQNIWGSHGGEDVDCGPLDCDALRSCRWLPTFRRRHISEDNRQQTKHYFACGTILQEQVTCFEA